MLGSIKKNNFKVIAGKITATVLGLTIVTSSLSTFALTSENFSISSSALTANWCDAFVLKNDLICPYADFTPFVNMEQDVYEIKTPEQFAAFSILTNAMPDPRITIDDSEWPRFKVNPYESDSPTVEPTFFTGKTVKLVNDINLFGLDFIPVASADLTIFNGVFDGNNKTIRNVNIGTKISFDEMERDLINSHSALGLFGNVRGEIKNLNVEGLSISADCAYLGGIAAVVEGDISNVTLVNSSIDVKHADHVGGIVGKLSGNISGVKVCNTNISVEDATNVGGIIGCTDKEGSYDYGRKAPKEYNVSDSVRINQILDTFVDGVKINTNAKNVGGIAGNLDVYSCDTKTTFLQLFYSAVSNTIINTVGSINVGGICGSLVNSQVRDCLTDSISIIKHDALESSNVGGIIGYIDNSEILGKVNNSLNINVSNNSNDETVNAGGILGKACNTILNDCINFSSSIDEIDAVFVGGIVGYGKNSEILNCINRANKMSVLNAYLGGVVGLSIGNVIKESYSYSQLELEITDDKYSLSEVGGLIGLRGPNNNIQAASNGKVACGKMIGRTIGRIARLNTF